jgi:hypothetical protein
MHHRGNHGPRRHGALRCESGGRNCVRVARPSGIAIPTEEQPKEMQVMTP